MDFFSLWIPPLVCWIVFLSLLFFHRHFLFTSLFHPTWTFYSNCLIFSHCTGSILPCRCFFSPALKPITEPALFTFSGISFQFSTTLCEKNCLSRIRNTALFNCRSDWQNRKLWFSSDHWELFDLQCIHYTPPKKMLCNRKGTKISIIIIMRISIKNILFTKHIRYPQLFFWLTAEKYEIHNG